LVEVWRFAGLSLLKQWAVNSKPIAFFRFLY